MRHVARALVLLAAIAGSAAGAYAQAPRSGESQEHLIKAGYIYNFAKLVEWPSRAARPGQPIVIAVVGDETFAGVLARVVDGKQIDDRPFDVRRLASRDLRDCSCHILFISGAETVRMEEIVQLQSTVSVLTIADGPDFARRGGVVAFTLEDSRVRFLINVDAAAQARLTVSSRLLALATVVHTERR